MPAYSSGPLSLADFQNVWQGVVDPGYAQGFVQAGEGAGYEAYTQAMAQLARVSTAIDRSTQAMFILPWSGQTNPPASGAALATVQLTLARTLRLHEPLVLGAGLVWFDEVAPMSAVGQGTTIVTGRRYTLAQDLVFLPGQAGPFTVAATAERPGYGYNDPLPGTISLVENAGTGIYNSGAVLSTTAAALAPASVQNFALSVANDPDVVIPQNVGQYVALAGLPQPNAYRMTSYASPSGSFGGTVGLEVSLAFQGTVSSGTFLPGEVLTVKSGATVVAYLTAKSSATISGAVVVLAGFRSSSVTPAVAPGYTVAGQSSGATLTIAQVLGDAVPTVAYPLTTSWQVLDWARDWGLTCANAAQPSGGLTAVLDELGRERKIPRQTAEPDSTYRQRVAVPADVVTPNAVKRMLNRVLTKPLGLAWCFREVGTSLLPGFFWDLDAYDYDAVVVAPTSSSGAFQPGEQVRQLLANGQVAQGHALVSYAVPSTPWVPGQAATTGIGGASPLLHAVADINPQAGGAFVPGLPIVGLASSAAATPTSLAGGLVPGNRFKVLLDYLRFRAYFLVDVQLGGAGDFGFGWGGAASGSGALFDYWDCAPFPCFYDGFPVTADSTYAQAYSSVDAIRAGGVYWEMDPMLGPCV